MLYSPGPRNAFLPVLPCRLSGDCAKAAAFNRISPPATAAITAAFVDRFAIGLVIGCIQLPWPGWVTGLVFGLLLSVPSAIITKAFVPILAVGAVLPEEEPPNWLSLACHRV